MEPSCTGREPESLRENCRPIPDALQDDWNTGTVCDQILGSPF